MLEKKQILLMLVASATWTGARSAQETHSVEERLDALESKDREQEELLKKAAGGDTMRVFWKDGVRFETADKRYKFRIGGRIHYDVSFFDPDDDTRTAVETGTNRIEDGSQIRRARINFSGEVGERVDWMTAIDFGGGSTNFRDVYVGASDFFFGDIRAGQYREPYSLEQLTSSNNVTFIERSLMDSLVPGRNAGVMIFNQPLEERMTWSIGAFRTGSDNGEVSRGDGEWSATARLTGLPFWGKEGRRYVHLGLAGSFRNPTDDAVTISVRPEANLAPPYLQLTNLPADDFGLVGAEAAWVLGPFSLQGEYSLASVEAPSDAGSDADFSAWYAQASWFLTGESRPYRKAAGCFDAVKPENSAFAKEGGSGAWEVATRWSSIDLDDGSVDGGELGDWTVGLNWYLNPNTRLMANYILSDLSPAGDLSDGMTNTLLFRVQFAF